MGGLGAGDHGEIDDSDWSFRVEERQRVAEAQAEIAVLESQLRAFPGDDSVRARLIRARKELAYNTPGCMNPDAMAQSHERYDARALELLLLCSSTDEAVDVLRQETALTRRSVVEIFERAARTNAPLTVVRRERAISRLERLSSKAEEEGDLRTAVSAAEKAGKLCADTNVTVAIQNNVNVESAAPSVMGEALENFGPDAGKFFVVLERAPRDADELAAFSEAFKRHRVAILADMRAALSAGAPRALGSGSPSPQDASGELC